MEFKRFVISAQAYNKYMQTLANQICSLSKAADGGDLPTIREICHRIKGSAAIFDLIKIGKICALAEKAAIRGNLPRALFLIRGLRASTTHEAERILEDCKSGMQGTNRSPSD